MTSWKATSDLKEASDPFIRKKHKPELSFWLAIGSGFIRSIYVLLGASCSD